MSAVVAGFRTARLTDIVGGAVADALRRNASALNNTPNIRSVSVVAKVSKQGTVRTVLVTVESETDSTDTQ